ncbi:putative histidine kinase HHK6p [Stemphylium lycopersici]|nr:putative histidine kinase HHK6p [Stemphylium lycopersici]
MTEANGGNDGGYFAMGAMGQRSRSQSPSSIRSSSISMHMTSPSATTASLTALQYLPVPILVLSSQKTVLLANESMGRLFGIDFESIHDLSISEVLQDKTMGELGVDILQNGSPILITWEAFLDCVVKDAVPNTLDEDGDSHMGSGHTTPTAANIPCQINSQSAPPLAPLSSTNLARTTVYDVSVDVVVAPLYVGPDGTLQKCERKAAYKDAMQATCIVSIWSIEDAQYYTLTFTSATSVTATKSAQPSSRMVNRTNTGAKLDKSRSSGSSTSSGRRSGSSSNSTSKVVTPTLQQPEFPPRGPPSKNVGDLAISASVFQKATQLKDAILNSITMPAYAMWKDESFGIPNKALLRLLSKDATYAPGDQRDFLSQFSVWTEDFQRLLSVDEFPIVEVCRTQKRVEKQRLGLRQPQTGTRIVYEINGEPVFHEETGDFLGGIVIFKDITEYTNQIAAQIEENEKQFEYIANFMPVMIIKWFGTCTDIHDLVLARQEARQTREQLQQVIQHAKIVLWVINRKNEVKVLEGELAEHQHLRKDELLGKNIYDVFELGGNDRERWRGPIQEILQGKQSDEIVNGAYMSEARYYRTRLVPLMSTSRISGMEGRAFVDGVIGVSMDITELREREEQLKEQEKENARLLANEAAAKEASRMKSQFLANMSHEIRTPIAGVIGMSELLFDMNLNEEQKECAENIHRSANSLLTVINDILDFSKVESGRLDVEEVQFSLSVVLRDVNKMMAFAANRKGLDYHSSIQDEVQADLRVMGDPGRLRQILTNVLTNSIKFTSVGTVQLSVSISQESKDMVTVNFSIVDTGIGIEEEVRKRLFQPFSQADSSTARRFGGTGLGLTISKNLVELMKGQIWLDSKLGQGTTATFWIPFTRAPSQDSESPLVHLESIPDRLQSDMSVSCGSSEGHTPPLTPNGNSAYPLLKSAIPDHLMNLSESEREQVHVLVVEDNHINQQIALKTIKKLHFSVNAVWNGQEALEYLTKDFGPSHPRPDIILMDVQMPIRDGYSATHAIRTEAPWRNMPEIRGVPIVAMTASAIQGDKEKCVSCGMDDYLAKPVKGKLLERMLVKWAIEGRRKTAKGTPSAIDNDRRGVAKPKPRKRSSAKDHPRTAGTSLESETTAQALTAELDRLHYQSDAAFARSSENEGERAMRRINAEERDRKLRDEKLYSLVGPQLRLHDATEGPQSEPSMPLTEANIEKLVHEQDADAPITKKSASSDKIDTRMTDNPTPNMNSTR